MKRRLQHQNDGRVDPKSQERDALLREIEASALSLEDKRLITMVATQPDADAVVNARSALSAAIRRMEQQVS